MTTPEQRAEKMLATLADAMRLPIGVMGPFHNMLLQIVADEIKEAVAEAVVSATIEMCGDAKTQYLRIATLAGKKAYEDAAKIADNLVMSSDDYCKRPAGIASAVSETIAERIRARAKEVLEGK